MRTTHTTVFGIPVVEYWLEREIYQWVHWTVMRKIKPLSNRGEEGGVCIDFKPVAYQGFKEAWGGD